MMIAHSGRRVRRSDTAPGSPRARHTVAARDADAFARGRSVLAEVAATVGGTLQVHQDAPGFTRLVLTRGGEGLVIDLVKDVGPPTSDTIEIGHIVVDPPGDLVKFMTEGPVVVQVLECEGAAAKNRQVIGATNPEKADAGTIRKEFATNIERNAVHGSDAPETAKEEIAFFSSTAELASLARS